MRLHKKIKDGVYCIAEMSANHAGKLDNALAIVHAAHKAGADCLKIQTYTADSMTIDCNNEYFTITDGLWSGSTLYDLYQNASTPYEWQQIIRNECNAVGIDFLSTPFDKEGVDFLEELGVEAYKVASFELVDLPLISYIASKGKPMIVSCGMGTLEEINDALVTMSSAGLSKEKIVLLKCTSEYPAKTEDMNLTTIPDMIDRFGTHVGLSDHSIGIIAPTVAVSLGARVVEKHFCLSRELDNPDSKFSSEPHEFAAMVEAVDLAFAARGKATYGPAACEKSSLNFRRSIFAIEDISKNELFTTNNIRIIRPGHGIAPKYYDSLLGQKSKHSYKKGFPIQEL